MKSRAAGLELLSLALAEGDSHEAGVIAPGTSARLEPDTDHLDIRIGEAQARFLACLCTVPGHRCAWCDPGQSFH